MAIDITTYRYNGVSLDVSAQEALPGDVVFKPDGTRMFLTGVISGAILEYELSTAWDVSTATYTDEFSIAGQESQLYGLAASSDGTKFYGVGLGSETVYEYDLGTAWDISTAAYNSVSFSVATQAAFPYAVAFSSDGTKMYTSSGGFIYEYDLGTAWDLSTASYNSNAGDISAQTPSGGKQISFSGDGLQVVIENDNGGGDRLIAYDLSTAWDITTITYSGELDINSIVTDSRGGGISADGEVVYVSDNATDTIYQFSPIPPIDLTSNIGAVSVEMFLAFNVVSTLGSVSSDTYSMGHVHETAFAAASSITYGRARFFISTMGGSTALDVRLDGNMTLASAMQAASAANITHVLELMAAAQLAGTDDIQHAKVVAFLASLAMSSTRTDEAGFVVDVATAMTIRSYETYGWDFEAVSAAQLASSFEHRYNTVYAAVSEMQLASTEDIAHSIGMLFTSAGQLASSHDTQAALQLDLFDALVGQTLFKLGDDVYQGWVFSTEAAAFTEYGNYPFNSMAMYRGKPYGVADDGIYLLEGDDDAGADIDAAVKTKLSSFRQRAIKDARAAYIGYTSDGRLVMKVTTVQRGGQKREDWYLAQHGSSQDFQTTRTKIQRGLRSTYWQFELVNKDGADFEIEDVTIQYEVLSRRIR